MNPTVRTFVNKVVNRVDQGDSLGRSRKAVVVSVQTTTATVNLGGKQIASVPFLAHVTGMTAGSLVYLDFDEESPTIIGRLP